MAENVVSIANLRKHFQFQMLQLARKLLSFERIGDGIRKYAKCGLSIA
jgi:hypothetical protein